MNLIAVTPEVIDEWWDRMQPYLASFIERAGGRYLAEDIRDLVKSKKSQLWLASDGAEAKAVCMTHLIQYPRCRDLRIFIMAGEFHELWIDFIDKLEGFARAHGCAKITGEARPGWEKVLSPRGYRRTHVYLEKDL